MANNQVYVGFSGGVDSLAAALLLKEAGHIVTAVHLILHDPSPDTTARHLQSLADTLKISLIIKDLRTRFRETIIKPFAEHYLSGKTPNPCIWCNERIKLQALAELIREHGVPWMATGHYAKKIFDSKSGRWFIARGEDRAKDQSYFLAFVSQEHLSPLLLPLGGETKRAVKAKVTSLYPQVTGHPESHDICFLKGTSLPEFITAWVGSGTDKGTFIDRDGNVLGTHGGVSRFTIGQRRGIGIADRTPYYVTALFPDKNQVQIGKEEDLFRSTFRVTACHWHLPPDAETLNVSCQIRYRHTAAPAALKVLGLDQAEVTFEKPQRAITPGQIAAFYQGDRLIGAGVIETVAP